MTFHEWSIRWKIGLHLLVIFILIVAHLGGVWWFVQEQEDDGTAINKAGEQRMLTQKMTWEAHKIGMGHDDQSESLAKSAAEFDRTLTALIEGNESMGIPPAPPPVREQLLAVSAEWDPFYAHVQTILEESPATAEFTESLEYIETNNERVLSESDRAVQEYERAFDEKITRLQLFLLGLFVLDLLVIPLLFSLVNRQIVRPVDRITAEARSIANGDLQQSITIVEAGDEIGTLTRSIHKMKDRLVSSLSNSRRFEQAVEHAGHAIYITDPDGTIEYVNPAFVEITSYSKEQAIGENSRILKAGYQPGSYYEDMWSTIGSGEVWKENIVNKRATGELFHAFQTIAPITDDGDEIIGFVAIMADDTEQLVSNQQNQVLSRVLRHNLRTELTLIGGYAQELAEATDVTVRTDFLRKIGERIDSLVASSATVERFSRAFHNETWRQAQDLCAAVERVCGSIEEQYPHAEISVDVPPYEVNVMANIEDVVEALVKNAVEHNDQDIPEINVTVELQRETAPPPTVRLEVEDNGPGIPPAERKVIEDGEESPLYHGSGVGLWITHWTILLAGGRVGITDRSPQGTRVAITLPRASVGTFPRRSAGDGCEPRTADEHVDSLHNDD